jgi:hypothetical protein
MKKILLFVLFAICLPGLLLAQDTESTSSSSQYGMGSQMFTFRAGPVVPAFFFRPDQSDTFLSFDEMRMKVGGYGSIRYQGFLNNTLALGGELGYLFSYDIGGDLFTSVPFQAKLTWIPLQGTLELPLSIGLGFAYNSYNSLVDTSFLSLLSTFEAGISWYFREDWGITIGTGLQVIPEIYGNAHTYPNDTTIAGFMPITLSVTYRSN